MKSHVELAERTNHPLQALDPELKGCETGIQSKTSAMWPKVKVNTQDRQSVGVEGLVLSTKPYFGAFGAPSSSVFL